MKNTIRATLVAGLIGGAALGLAGGANAAVTPGHQAWPAGTAAAHSQQFFGHKADEDDASDGPAQDVSAFDNQSDEPAANDEAPEAPAEAPADSAPEAPAEAPADSAPESPAEAPADSAPEAPAEAPADSPADAPAETPDSEPVADAPAPSQDDIAAAEADEPALADPAPAQASDIEQMTELVQETMTSETTTTGDEWNREVTEWNSSWVSYDAYNRPIVMNPYNNPMQLFYTYGNAPRIVTVPPLQRVVLNAPTSGVYPFTAVVQSPSGPIRQVSVGSFTGGGAMPQPGQKPAPKPAPPAASNNVLVQLRYSTGTSQPFRVKTLADLGDDSAMGARRVLIDGTVSAWGQWSKTQSGEREFVITKTLQLPGLATPSEAPLPGYNVAISKR